MPTQKWDLDSVKTVVNQGGLENLSAVDLVEIDKILRHPDLEVDDIIVAARGYLFDAAEKRIGELAEKDFTDTNDDDLNSFENLLERFSNRDADGYKGKAAEVMKRIALRREFLKKRKEEASKTRLNKLKNMTPAELWEFRKGLKLRDTLIAKEANEEIEVFVIGKAEQFVKGQAVSLSDNQAPALKKLLNDIEKNPLTEQTDEQKEILAQALTKVDEQIADFNERHRLQEIAWQDEAFVKNMQILDGMPSDEVLFARGEDGKFKYSEFEEIDNILSHLQVKGELSWFRRKNVEQTSLDSDIALFKERIRLETQGVVAAQDAEPITEETFRKEYASRLNQGIFEIVYANALVEGKVSQKDMSKLISALSKSAQKGKPISVHQDVFVGWQAAHQAESIGDVKSLEELGAQKSAKLWAGKLKAFGDKCQKKYPNAYNKVLGLLETGCWGAAYGIASSLGPAAPIGIAAVATASFVRSGYRFYKSYKKARDEASAGGKKLGFWSFVKKNKMQSVGVLLSATAVVTGGLDVAGVFAGNSEVLAGITQVRMGSGIALWGASTAKQVADAYRQGGWRSAVGTAGLSLLSFGGGLAIGRAASSLASNAYNSYVDNGTETADVIDVGHSDVENIVEKPDVQQSVEPDSVQKVAVDVKSQVELDNVHHNEPLLQQQETVVREQTDNTVNLSDRSQETTVSLVDEEQTVLLNEQDANSQEQLPENVSEITDSFIDDLQTIHWDAQDIELENVSETIDGVSNEMPNSDTVSQNVDVQHKPEPLFVPEGRNEDGSLYGTTVGGRHVTDFSIDEEGNVLSLTVDGEEISDTRLKWINDHPDIPEGWEKRALATVDLADDLLREQPRDLAEHLEGEWQEHEVHVAETKEMPGTPMSVEDHAQPVVETPGNEEVVGSHTNTNGWERNAQGVEVDPNPNRPMILQVSDKAATLSWADGENLQSGQFIQEPDVKGNMQTLGRDTNGHLYKLVEMDIGESQLDLPPEHPNYNELNTPRPSRDLTGLEKAQALSDFIRAGKDIDNLRAQLSSSLVTQQDVTGHITVERTSVNSGPVKDGHSR